MNPIAFSLFGLEIRWYGILISTGIIAGVLLSYYTCKVRNLSFDTITNIFLVSLPIAIIGARLYYVIFEFSSYNNNILDMINTRNGGLAIHGGLIFGLSAAIIYCIIKKVSFFQYVDAAAPSIAIGQAIGRWGNFFNGEAHGGPVSYEFIKKFPQFIQRGMHIDGVYYHPTFLYESIWDLAIVIILLLILKYKNTKKGTVIFTYIGLYSIGRYFIEGLRTDSLMFGGLRMAQMVSLAGVVAWVIYLVYSHVSNKKL